MSVQCHTNTNNELMMIYKISITSYIVIDNVDPSSNPSEQREPASIIRFKQFFVENVELLYIALWPIQLVSWNQGEVFTHYLCIMNNSGNLNMLLQSCTVLKVAWFSNDPKLLLLRWNRDFGITYSTLWPCVKSWQSVSVIWIWCRNSHQGKQL